jgi:hypothetical protein
MFVPISHWFSRYLNRYVWLFGFLFGLHILMSRKKRNLGVTAVHFIWDIFDYFGNIFAEKMKGKKKQIIITLVFKKIAICYKKNAEVRRKLWWKHWPLVGRWVCRNTRWRMAFFDMWQWVMQIADGLPVVTVNGRLSVRFRNDPTPGLMLRFFKNIFAEKNGVSDSKQKLNSCKNLIIALVFVKNANLCRKSQKIVIICNIDPRDRCYDHNFLRFF